MKEERETEGRRGRCFPNRRRRRRKRQKPRRGSFVIGSQPARRRKARADDAGTRVHVKALIPRETKKHLSVHERGCSIAVDGYSRIIRPVHLSSLLLLLLLYGKKKKKSLVFLSFVFIRAELLLNARRILFFSLRGNKVSSNSIRCFRDACLRKVERILTLSSVEMQTIGEERNNTRA